MNLDEPVVFVVDDDPSVRNALARLIKSAGFSVQAFENARSFLNLPEHRDIPCCLVLDIRLPQMSGLELQEEMTERGLSMPIIFITGHGTIPISVQAMKAGAMDFLEKPFEEQELLDAIHKAVEKSRQANLEEAERQQILERADSLTPREYEVFRRVVSGIPNKEIGHQLGTTEKTIKVHRARVMDKMMAKNLAALVRMAEKINVFNVPD